MADIAVIGGGVVGVATCWFLCKEGHRVTLIDRNPGPGQGESFANGAQLSWSYCDALGSPAFLRHLPDIVAGRDPAYRLRLSLDPDFLIWGLRFLANCRRGAAWENTRHLFDLARSSSEHLAALIGETGIAFGYQVSGKMILYNSDRAFDAARPGVQMKRDLGLGIEVLTREEATAVEPALDGYRDPIAKVVYSPGDAVGLPAQFCQELVAHMRENHGLRVLFGHEVRGILSQGGRVTGLEFARAEPIACSEAVLASGHDLSLLPGRDRRAGAIWPVQGYSLTRRATERSLRTSITDVARKMVFAPVGDAVRIAGLADFGGRRPHFVGQRMETLRITAESAFDPWAAGDHGSPVSSWTGVRPCTPHSRPQIRATSLKGLYLNLGHGTLGWTLCLGSGARLSTIMAGYRT